MTTKTSLSVEKLLEKLITDETPPTLQDLSAFSDLSRSNWGRVREMWSAIPEQRRFEAVQLLVEAAYEDIQLQLGRLLRVALEDDSERVRAVAIAGLWEDTSEDLIGPLVQTLHNDPSQIVRGLAAGALGPFILGGELEEIDAAQAMRAEEALLAVLRNDEEPLSVQCQALESLSFSGEAGVRQLIEDAYYSPYDEMQVSALVAMGRSADTRWRSAAQQELDNSSPEIRAAAARTCGELEAVNALDDILNLLADEDKNVRLAAIFALSHIGGDEAEDALNAMLESEDPDEVIAAEDALEEIVFFGDTDAIPLFDESQDEWETDDDIDEW
ncbi:MAG: HEAT repeat domain-containing protein [Caldilineaceae bacterium]